MCRNQAIRIRVFILEINFQIVLYLVLYFLFADFLKCKNISFKRYKTIN